MEKGERVTTGGKGRGEAGEVTGVVANAITTDSMGKKKVWSILWMGLAAGKVEVLLVLSELDVDRSA